MRFSLGGSFAISHGLFIKVTDGDTVVTVVAVFASNVDRRGISGAAGS